jgi:hypothetical protein
MPRPRTARPPKAHKAFVLQKPNGQFTPRVQAVGPEHFGIVAIDCAIPPVDFLSKNRLGAIPEVLCLLP